MIIQSQNSAKVPFPQLFVLQEPFSTAMYIMLVPSPNNLASKKNGNKWNLQIVQKSFVPFDTL